LHRHFAAQPIENINEQFNLRGFCDAQARADERGRSFDRTPTVRCCGSSSSPGAATDLLGGKAQSLLRLLIDFAEATGERTTGKILPASQGTRAVPPVFFFFFFCQ
jgi:hypothetical protein